jgi:hypothetical protein
MFACRSDERIAGCGVQVFGRTVGTVPWRTEVLFRKSVLSRGGGVELVARVLLFVTRRRNRVTSYGAYSPVQSCVRVSWSQEGPSKVRC